MSQTTYEVKLKCYDISRGVAKTISLPLLQMQLEAVWHTAILCHNTEWFYGGGIQYAPPDIIEREYDMHPLKVIPLGSTDKSESEIRDWCTRHNDEFSELQYDFLHHNCNHFTDALAKYLHNDSTMGIPLEILNQHEIISTRPGGKVIIAMIEAAQKQAKGLHQNNGGSSGAGNFLTTGRLGQGRISSASPPSSSPPVPIPAEPAWTQVPNKFENLIWRLWNDPAINPELKNTVLRRLYLLAYNITRNATDPKYRSVRSDNAVIQSSILAIGYGEELLNELGFAFSEGIYTVGDNLTREILSHLNKAVILLTPVVANEKPAAPRTHQKYEQQLNRLQELGFHDISSNLRALVDSSGNLNRAIDHLIGAPTSAGTTSGGSMSGGTTGGGGGSTSGGGPMSGNFPGGSDRRY